MLGRSFGDHDARKPRKIGAGAGLSFAVVPRRLDGLGECVAGRFAVEGGKQRAHGEDSGEEERWKIV